MFVFQIDSSCTVVIYLNELRISKKAALHFTFTSRYKTKKGCVFRHICQLKLYTLKNSYY